ncbi:ASCH domain-containing protein [Paraburkholderia sp. SARCC-3016]|uniref:ASCH domain-containing protein n=1 Tax=Paraburkholderia sp. SARCC-3016 TaxID=3058611 RepID=UPI002807E0E5|nr:ASCH domain-containing protein [Paraburkholderia sp. SARCC-3016]MDQ7979048.1 ASCH domain-containing protein [Paraburkholderia sp. SARCC-3016]
MKVILSIKPEYADKILDGTKKFEFRKAAFSSGSVETVLIYATKPVGKVVGEFEVAKVHIDAPKKIWNITKQAAGIKKSFFDAYYTGRDTAVAIAVGRVKKYEEPVSLQSFGPELKAPQSFRYLPTNAEDNRQLNIQFA